MNEDLIAPCGMNCGVCSSYLAMKHELRKKGAMRTYCAGCRIRGKKCYYTKKCGRLGKGPERFCYECGDFPCRLIKTLDERYRTFYRMSMIENLEFIQEHGMKNFLKRETAKWRCAECGGVICCHNGLCYNCGLEKLKKKKRKYRWDENEAKSGTQKSDRRITQKPRGD